MTALLVERNVLITIIIRKMSDSENVLDALQDLVLADLNNLVFCEESLVREIREEFKWEAEVESLDEAMTEAAREGHMNIFELCEELGAKDFDGAMIGAAWGGGGGLHGHLRAVRRVGSKRI